MFVDHLRRNRDEFYIQIPESEVMRWKLHAGQMVRVTIEPADSRHGLRPEIARLLEESTETVAPVMKYLRDK